MASFDMQSSKRTWTDYRFTMMIAVLLCGGALCMMLVLQRDRTSFSPFRPHREDLERLRAFHAQHEECLLVSKEVLPTHHGYECRLVLEGKNGDRLSIDLWNAKASFAELDDLVAGDRVRLVVSPHNDAHITLVRLPP